MPTVEELNVGNRGTDLEYKEKEMKWYIVQEWVPIVVVGIGFYSLMAWLN